MDLEKQIRDWRKALHTQGKFEDGHLEELESHLRDHIEHLIDNGFSEGDAFEEAKKQIGEPTLLGEENYKTEQRKHWGIINTIMPALLANYLKIGLRQFNRHKLYAWINVGGLSLGLVCFLLISYYVMHEFSYDRQYSEKAIYRIGTEQISLDGTQRVDAGGPVPLGTVLKDELPEIKESVRFWRAYLPSLKAGDQVFEETEFLFADPKVLEIFDFALQQGNPNTALVGPNKLVVSESMAIKYFGTHDVIGKTLEYDGYPGNDMSFTISGVFYNLPSNTHFSFDFLASFETLSDDWGSWGSFKPVWTYVVLNEGTSPLTFEEKLQAIPLKYFPDRVKENESFKLTIEPIRDIYLYSEAARPMKPNGNLALIKILAAIGFLILTMCCVNFINISLARAMTRQKEIGVRKVLGAMRRNLVSQFLMEVVVTFLFSLVLAIGTCFMLRNVFTSFTGFELELGPILSPIYLITITSALAILILLAGLYPSLMLAGFNALSALSQRVFSRPGTSSISLRKGLILFQCVVSSVLIIGILGINDQLTYIEGRSPGVNMDQMVVIPYSAKHEAFENKLAAIPGVIDYGYSQQLPVNNLNYDGRIINLPGSEEVIQLQSSFVSANFIDLYNIQLLAGQTFNPDTKSDSNRFILNETAVQILGWDPQTALGKELVWSNRVKGEVIGVVNDFHLNSIHEAIPPMIMLPSYHQEESWKNLFISVKLESNTLVQSLAAIESEWRSINNARPYSYFFMEDSYRNLHTEDFRFGQLILVFTAVAIAISSLGLFALSAYTAERRRKEIGVRKVLGSTVAQVFYKIGAPFMLITLLAVMLAIPITVWSLNKWLETFAYHAALQPFSFLIGVLIVMVITLLSILKETLRASLINPVKLLHEE